MEECKVLKLKMSREKKPLRLGSEELEEVSVYIILGIYDISG